MLAMSTAVENAITRPHRKKPVRLRRPARTLFAWMRP